MEPIDLEWLNEEQNEIMNNLMQSELTGIEEILEDPTHSVRVAYNELRDPRREHMEVEDALGFTYLIEAADDIMEALEKLYKSGLSLAKIKKAMKEWQEEFFTDRFGNPIDTPMGIGFDEYTEFIIARRKQIEDQDLEKSMKKRFNGALGDIEKCMDFHMRWGFTMAVLKKFEKKNKKVTAIQSRQRGNKDRRTVEKTHGIYMDTTSHWKKKNKSKVKAELIASMIHEDMSPARKTALREEIDDFMKDKFKASKKKTKRKKKSAKKSDSKKKGKN
tara:strand:+ start:2062 stop:2886 length:825 start_codon:yes stop_codon:yes gene_type:complete